ncbi:hypothetical protein Tco_0402764 [Tanacetum coccineum]
MYANLELNAIAMLDSRLIEMTRISDKIYFRFEWSAVDWKSSKQSTTAMSATESEYIAASEAVMEVV